jgi:hypothetical protein
MYKSGNTSECGFKEQFRKGTVINGTLVNDTINFFENTSIPNVTFALFNSLPPSLIGSSANGLLGLSSWGTKFPHLNFLQQIAPTVGSSNFSLCFGEFGGQLVLGGYDSVYASDEIYYVPLINNSKFVNYTVELTDFKIGSHSAWEPLWFNTTKYLEGSYVSPKSKYATVDSGNQYLMLPESAYGALTLLFQQLLCPDRSSGPIGICGEENFFTGECYILDDINLAMYPTIELTLGSGAAALTIPPSNYFIDYNGASCLAFGSTTGDDVIIGNRIMQEYYTIFEPSIDRIGFTKAVNCSGAQYRAEAVSGDKQVGVVGKKLGKPFVVRVLRINDSMPMENITVTFNVVDIQPATEVMWISQAIWNSKAAWVEPVTVITGKNGTAETYLWLEGAADTNTVTADVPLCLNHVVFYATGEPSIVWSILVYLFLAVLITLVVFLHIWYGKTVKKRKFERFNSALNISTTKLFRSPEDEDAFSDPVESPPLSPSLSPPALGIQRDKQTLSNRSVNFSEKEEDDEDDDDPFQSTSRTWYQSAQRKAKFEMWRLQRQVSKLFKKSDR